MPSTSMLRGDHIANRDGGLLGTSRGGRQGAVALFVYLMIAISQVAPRRATGDRAVILIGYQVRVRRERSRTARVATEHVS